MRDFYLLDAAIEWAEDQVVYRHGGVDRLPRHDRAFRAAAARRTVGRRARGLGRARHDQDLSPRREDRRRRRTRHLAVLPQKRRGACHAARRRAAGDTDRRHGLWRDGAAGSRSLRRRAGGCIRHRASRSPSPISSASAISIPRPANASCATLRKSWPSG